MHGGTWPLTLLCSSGSARHGCLPDDTRSSSPKEVGVSEPSAFDISPSDLHALARIAGLDQTCGEKSLTTLGPCSIAGSREDVPEVTGRSRCRNPADVRSETRDFKTDLRPRQDAYPPRGHRALASTAHALDTQLLGASHSAPSAAKDVACWPALCSGRPCASTSTRAELERAMVQRQLEQVEQDLRTTQDELAQERVLREETLARFAQMANTADSRFYDLGNKVSQLEGALLMKAESSVHSDTFRQLEERVLAGEAGEWSEFQHLMRRVELMDALAASQGRELDNLRRRLDISEAAASASSTSGSPRRQRLDSSEVVANASSTSGSPRRRSDPGRPVMQPGWVGL